MLHYIIQTIVFQLFFLIMYDVFLKKETFFNWNRFYLLASAVLSISLPFVKIEYFKTVIPVEYTIRLPEIILNGGVNEVVNDTNRPVLNALNTNQDSFFIWSFMLYLGCIIALLFFIYKLSRILLLAYKNPKTKFKEAVLIQLSNSQSAFSFFNYIFIGEQIQGEEKKAIIAHEEVHVKQKHSIDLLFFEVLRILFWFNPLIYMYQIKIADTHEFIADSEAVKINKTAYYENLLAQVFQTKKVSFINPFFKKSLIKKRIIMLNKTKSKQLNVVKYALLIPMVIGMLFYTSCTDDVVKEDTVAVSKNLERYTFTLEEEEVISEEKQELYNEAEKFVRINSDDYNFRTSFNEATKITTYSVHAKSEAIPESYDNQIDLTFTDGTTISKYTQKGARYLNTKDIAKVNIIKMNGKNMPERKPVDDGTVAFSILDRVPVYPGCNESMSNEALKKCFGDRIAQLVMKNFNTKKLEAIGEVGKHKISVFFNINEEGVVNDLRFRSEYKEFEAEARRVMELLPALTPGEYDGKKASTNYYLPIKFELK